MTSSPPPKRGAGPLLAVLALILAMAGALIAALVPGPSPTPPPAPVAHTVTVTLGGPGRAKVALDPRDQATVKAQVAEGDLRAAPTPSAAAAAHARALTPAGQPPIPAHVPLATVHTPGCTTALVRNYSSRNGAPVLLGVIHWTGSAPGSGPAIVRWFDTPAAQASSNYIVDRAGQCWLTVAESQKAWTQAYYNPWSVSVEIVNQGVMPLFQDVASRDKVIALMRGWHQRWGIPYRYARVSGGRVVRSGFLAHRDLGALGGGHPDVGSYDLAGLIRLAAQGATAAKVHRITHADRRACRQIKRFRARRPQTRHERAAIKRRHDRLHARGLYCASGHVHHLKRRKK